MAALVSPELGAQLTDMAGRLWDLERPFHKRWYWDPAFQGRSSIKTVLPAMVPGMSYADLEVKAGNEAQLRYVELLGLKFGDPKRFELKKALLEYCARDTSAMVAVFDALKKVSDS
jgi:hypothetical protein